jgi:chitin biosynthesis protein CHS5
LAIQIEFPSILLPSSITSGSIVDITVSQNYDAEEKSRLAFTDLQSRILNTYGLHSPLPPTLRLRGATQTSLVLEWDPIQLATSNLKSLSLYRNGSKAGSIPRPKEMLSTKISGLAVDTEYSFHLVLRTTGGTYSSPVLTCRTHKMTDLSGITVTPGVLPEPLRASLESAVDRIGGRIVDTVRIDTTHFVCTEGRGKDWEKAKEMSIPVVRPEWVEGCEREGRIVGVRGYYLDANPKQRHVGSNPSLSGTTAGSSNVTIGAKGSQVNLPERRAPQPPAPRSPDRESHITGDGNGPGPEVPPTPPPKTERPGSPVSAEAASNADQDDEEEQEGDDTSEHISENAAAPVTGKSHKKEGKRSEASMKAKVEDDEEGEEDSGMDEVPL